MASYNLSVLKSENPDVKYAMQKKILKLSESSPKELYKDFDSFLKLMDDENNILSWTGILVLGNLAKVDAEKKIDKLMPKLFLKLNTGKMITAANTIKSLTAIGKARPDFADDIAGAMLKVKNYKYDTNECSSIAIGHVLKNIGSLWGSLSNRAKDAVIGFAKTEVNNTRPATAKKAQELIKKYERN